MNLYDTLEGSDYLELVIDTDALSVNVSANGEPDELLGEFDTWDALCDGYPALWRRVVDEYGGADAFCTPSGDPVAPSDLRAAVAREERRERARAAADDSEFRARLARAHDVLGRFDDTEAALARIPKRLRRDVDLTPEGLVDSFEHVIEIVRHDETAPLGGSKVGGHPHLPPDAPWPRIDGEPTYLLVQLALSEVAASDLSGLVPPGGILYAFVTENGRGVLVHHATPEALAPRAPDFDAPDYMRSMLETERRLSFVPNFYFRQTSDTTGPLAIARALGPELLADVADAMGIAPSHPCDAFGGDRIFGGDPVDWQSMGASYLDNPLFAQLNFGDGHQSIGVHPDDLRIAFFDDADCRYCGT